MMQPQQLQQPYQQPMTMLQTPILHANGPVIISPQKAIKKGRFRVVKGAPNEANAASTAGATDNQSAASLNNTEVGADRAPQPVSTVKKGRFVVKKATVAGAECAAKNGKKLSPQGSDVAKTAKQTANENDVAVAQTKPGPDPCTKKKGRFLVKTGGSSANLAAIEATAAAGADVSTGTGMPPKAEKSSKQQNANWIGSGLDEATKTNGNVRDLSLDQTCTKKKGRFVVKTGGTAASPPAGINTTLSAPEGMQNTGIGHAHIVQLTSPNSQLPNYIAVDANGQVMGVLSMALPMSQTSQQHHLQQMPAFPTPQPQVQSQFVHPAVLSTTSSVGSQPHPQQPLHPPPNPSDAHQPLPPALRQRAMTDERASENVSLASKAHFPRTNRPCGGSSGSNWSSRAAPSGGKNGRLIGGGGVGKVLHHLDTLRSEVVEADRSIASLQSDNRFLRDKNKELEAKNKELERRLAEEKCLRRTAEAKCQTLNQKIRDQEMGVNIPQTGSGLHQLELGPAPSDDGRLENRGSLQPLPANATDHCKQPQAKASASKAATPSQPPVRVRSLTGPDSKTPLSHNKSFSAPDAARILAAVGLPPAGSQSMNGLSSIANNFDPLGTAPPSSVHQTNDNAVAQTTCMSAMASINNEHVGIPLVVTTQATSPPPNTNIGDAKCTVNANTKNKHFDPLGTPKRGSLEVNANVPALVLDGVPEMPAMATHIDNGNVTGPVIVPIHHQQQQRNQQEDPFDEIVRMSHSQGNI